MVELKVQMSKPKLAHSPRDENSNEPLIYIQEEVPVQEGHEKSEVV